MWPLPGTAAHPYDYAAGEHTVRDRVTGLEWQRNLSVPTYDWESALTYCAGLELADRADWRVPTRMELMSILNYAHESPAIDEAFFPDTPLAGFWTSSQAYGNTAQAWRVHFAVGLVLREAKTELNHVRCVR
jgi:hypothetical protein